MTDGETHNHTLKHLLVSSTHTPATNAAGEPGVHVTGTCRSHTHLRTPRWNCGVHVPHNCCQRPRRPRQTTTSVSYPRRMGKSAADKLQRAHHRRIPECVGHNIIRNGTEHQSTEPSSILRRLPPDRRNTFGGRNQNARAAAAASHSTPNRHRAGRTCYGVVGRTLLDSLHQPQRCNRIHALRTRR